MKRVFLAADYDKLVRAEEERGSWQVTRPLHGVRVNDLCADPANPRLVYAATQQEGLLRSSDSGKTWQSIGLRGTPVKSLALSPGRPGVIYAGCKPVSLYVTDDAGGTWQELPAMRRSRRWWWFSPADPPGMTPYVQALAVSPQNPDVIMAGIELGGVLRSTDGGRTWSRHHPGAVLDCHSLIFHHHQGSWVYAGGGGGVSFSQDGGLTWRKHRDGLKKIYVWMVAADPQKPEVWYASASSMPNPLRGEFVPPAHSDGKANATIYRSVGGAAWQPLSGGLPDPLNHMPYALITHPAAPGHLYAGLSSGEIWHTTNHGESWTRLPLDLGGIHNTMVLLAE